MITPFANTPDAELIAFSERRMTGDEQAQVLTELASRLSAARELAGCSRQTDLTRRITNFNRLLEEAK